MPFFTVIIPLYNKENYVENALKSIINQTFSDYEVLIINDGSTDKSIEKITPFLSEKIKLINHSENRGLSAARNTGIQKATSRYVTFLDADDLWKSNFLELIASLINNFPDARIFATNYEEIYGTKTLIPHNGTQHLAPNESTLIDFFKYNLQQGIYNHGSVCLAKEVYDKVGFYDETIDFSEDIDFNIRANSEFKLAFCNTIAMSYCMQSENQLTTSAISHKRLPNYNKYEVLAKTNSSLKKYLDFERYVLAKHVKTEGNTALYQKISAKIDSENLNWKQRLLLILPAFLLRFVNKTKVFLVRNGLKFTSY